MVVSVEHDRFCPVPDRCRTPDDGDIVVPHETEDWAVEPTIEECVAVLPPVRDAPEVRTW